MRKVRSHSKDRPIGSVALRTFFAISNVWDLSDEEKLKLLGQTDKEVVKAWANGAGPDVGRDTLERISYVLGIFKAINILLPKRGIASEWMRKPNGAPIFGGTSALDRMTAGNVSDLYVVRQYLDAELMDSSESPSESQAIVRGEA